MPIMGNYDILHITTVHPRDDIRIAVKEVYSTHLLNKWSVALVVADGQGNTIDGVYGFPIEDIGIPGRGRLGRFIFGFWRVFAKVRLFKPVVVHFHDPELILLGLVLKCFGYKVIYDVHEDVPRQILDKHWLPKSVRPVVSFLAEVVEWLSGILFNGIVAATPKIASRFPLRKTVTIQNFPRLDEFIIKEPLPYLERSSSFAYIGGITRGRGVSEMVKAISLLPDTLGSGLELAGIFKEPNLENEISAMPGWSHVNYHGWASRDDVAQILNSVCAGLLVLHPFQNHIDSYPNKLFEYMVCGLPVIASDFPLWREILSEVDNCLFVEPMDPHAIAEAMQWLLEHPLEAKTMGNRGRAAVESIFNWTTEEAKLIELYERLHI